MMNVSVLMLIQDNADTDVSKQTVNVRGCLIMHSAKLVLIRISKLTRFIFI